MKILALDFDGVICNSAHEVFLVALRSYANLVPSSPLVRKFDALALDRPGACDRLCHDPVHAKFRELTPLGNRAEDYGVALRSLDAGLSIDDQDEYDAFYAQQDRSWLDDFHRRFYENRERQRSGSTDRWLRLHSPYQELIDLLRRRAAEVTLGIATAKDRRSVELLLAHFGVTDLFHGDLILDKEIGVDKSIHLLRLATILSVEPEAMTFIDDKVNHLEKVAPVGVRPVLAGWGHNTPREQDRARRLGYSVATLENAELVLFS